MAPTVARGLIPRVVVDWQLECPTCGQAYVCPQDMKPRRELVAKA